MKIVECRPTIKWSVDKHSFVSRKGSSYWKTRWLKQMNYLIFKGRRRRRHLLFVLCQNLCSTFLVMYWALPFWCFFGYFPFFFFLLAGTGHFRFHHLILALPRLRSQEAYNSWHNLYSIQRAMHNTALPSSLMPWSYICYWLHNSCYMSLLLIRLSPVQPSADRRNLISQNSVNVNYFFLRVHDSYPCNNEETVIIYKILFKYS